MNRETIQGKWNELTGKIKAKWGKLTDDDLLRINGKREELLGSLQKRYGYAKERAEQELAAFEKSCGCSPGALAKKEVYETDRNSAAADKNRTAAKSGSFNRDSH